MTAGAVSAGLGVSLGLGKIVRDCSLTCNVGFDVTPLAILAIAVLALPLSALRVRLEVRWGVHGWQVGSVLGAVASLLAFRALTFWLLHSQDAAEATGLDPSVWQLALRWAYLAFYVWVGAVTALLGANAFGHVFRLYQGEEREKGFVAVGVAILLGGMLGSLLASAAASLMFRLSSWRFEVVRDNLMIAMALVLLRRRVRRKTLSLLMKWIRHDLRTDRIDSSGSRCPGALLSVYLQEERSRERN